MPASLVARVTGAGAFHAARSADAYLTAMIMLILLVVLVFALLGSFPAWPHARQWGYAPFSGLGVVVLILVVLYFTGHRF